MNNKASGGAGQVAVDRGPADPKGLGNGGHGVLPRRIHLLGHLELVAGQRRRSAAVAAAGPGRGQPRGRAFADEVAFEFGQGREHVEDELAARGGGVDRLLEAAEPDPTLGQAGDGVDQVAERLAEAVGRAPGHRPPWPASRGRRSLTPIAVHIGDGRAPFGGQLRQCRRGSPPHTPTIGDVPAWPGIPCRATFRDVVDRLAHRS
jgi:hypothetical protein